jgi:hypothetical protein
MRDCHSRDFAVPFNHLGEPGRFQIDVVEGWLGHASLLWAFFGQQEPRARLAKVRKRKSYFRLTTGSIAPGLTISSTLLATADEVIE